MSIVIVFCTALQRLIEKLDERLMDKHQGKNSRQQKRKRVNSKEFSRCPVPKDAPSWAVKTSVRIDIILCSYIVVCCVAKEVAMVMFIIQNTIFPQLIPTPGVLLFSSLKF